MLIYLALWSYGGRVTLQGPNWPRLAKMTPKAWVAVEKEVFAAFEIENGFLTAPDLVEQLARMRAKAAQNRHAGQLSGAIRRANSLK